ncbi:hypothetical protein IAU59_005984 [Kwoniella sp. CBS 9459]
MEVDTDRAITDDERMDEDFPVGEGEGMLEDSDGDEMMADEIQDDQEYEEAMDEENMEPELHTSQAKEAEVVPPEAPLTTGQDGSEPPIPFTPTDTPPVVTPFPEPASASASASTGFYGQASGSGSTTARPLESPPAPETDMTPAPLDENPPTTTDGVVGVQEVKGSTEEHPKPPLSTDQEGNEHISHPPQTVATTEEALDVLKSNPSATEPSINPSTDVTPTMAKAEIPAEMPGQTTSIPAVPPPHGGEHAKRAVSREATPRQDEADASSETHIEAGEEDEEYYGEGEAEEAVGEEEEEDEDEDYPIDVLNLPPIIIHLPQLGARSLFVPYESDPDTLPIWLRDRQEELGEASLADVWEALRAECVKEGLGQNGALVITEKQMDLKMNEDDVNLQSITFLELIALHHECGLPEPVQLYLTWEESRFITRFNAIQTEVEAVRRRRSESAQIGEDVTDDPAHVSTAEEKRENDDSEVQPVPKLDSSAAAGVVPVPKQVHTEVEPVAEAVEGDDEEYDEEEYAEDAGSVGAGAYSDVEEASRAGASKKRDYDHERRKHAREVKAEYAESNDDVNTRDLEQQHPQWAEARARPTDAMHYEGPPTNRQVIYHQETRPEPCISEAKAEPEAGPEFTKPAEALEVEGEEDVDAVEETEEYDDQEERLEGDDAADEGEEGGEWNDEEITHSSHERTESKTTEGEDEMQAPTVPVPIQVSKAQFEQLRADQPARLAQLRHEGLGQRQETGSVIAGSGAALPTPAAAGSAVSTQAGQSEIGLKVPLDDVALKHKYSGIPEGSEYASPAISVDASREVTERAAEDNEEFDLIQDEVPLDEVALKHEAEADAAQDESAAVSPAGSSRQVTEYQPPSQFATPAETTPVGTEVSMTASDLGGAQAIADRILGVDSTALRRPDVIPEEDEITISEREEIVNERAERDREAQEMPAPVDGVAGAGIVPEPVNDAEGEYSGYEEYSDGSYADGDYDEDESDLPGTMPVTPLETETGEGSLRFYPQGHPDADDVQGVLGDAGELDEGFSEEYEEEDGSERTLEEDQESVYDSYPVTAEPTMTESGDTDYPTSTVGDEDTLTMPPSAKRTLDDDEDTDSKRARTDEVSE